MRQERPGHPVADDETGRAAEAREDESFGHHLPDQPEATRAKCGADGHLALAGRGSHEQQVRDVHAREQQHEGGDAVPKNWMSGIASVTARIGSGRASGSGTTTRGHSRIGLGILLGQPVEHRVHLETGVLDRHAWLEAAEQLERTSPTVVVEPAIHVGIDQISRSSSVTYPSSSIASSVP